MRHNPQLRVYNLNFKKYHKVAAAARFMPKQAKISDGFLYKYLFLMEIYYFFAFV